MELLSIFGKLGLFTRSDFLDRDTCAQLRADMRRSARAAAEVFAEAGSAVRADIRRTQSIDVHGRAVQQVAERLEEIRGDLERHFGWALDACDDSEFLWYPTGGFYRPHRDRPLRADGAAAAASTRAVSVVVFLNDRSTHSDAFEGGALTFYGLVDEPRWRDVGLPLQPEEGLLVAFRSELLHEVAPVEKGDRFTIVTWFPRADARE